MSGGERGVERERGREGKERGGEGRGREGRGGAGRGGEEEGDETIPSTVSVGGGCSLDTTTPCSHNDYLT